MDLTPMGFGIALAVAIPSVALVVMGVVALRGTKPSERPEIIRALAELIGALRNGRGSPRRPGNRRLRR